MRFVTTIGLLVALCVVPGRACAGGEVTLKGKIMCAKCALKESKKCQTAIKVKEGDKEVTYYFLDKGSKEEYHEAVCGGGQKDGTVTGTVSEKDGKKWIAPKKVEYAAGSAQGELKGPRWHNSYDMAQELGRKAKKPLAVFIASGDAGWDKLARDGNLGDEVRHLLRDNYLCVYLNADSTEGKRLASAFEIRGGRGLVLSDRTGELQAFRHEGDLGNRVLARYLERYADPERFVRTTDTNPGEHEGHQPTAPTNSAVQPFAPAPVSAPASGSCPHCRGG